MATCIHSSRSCLPPFYTIPIFPLLNRKIFHLLVIVIAAQYEECDNIAKPQHVNNCRNKKSS